MLTPVYLLQNLRKYHYFYQTLLNLSQSQSTVLFFAMKIVIINRKYKDAYKTSFWPKSENRVVMFAHTPCRLSFADFKSVFKNLLRYGGKWLEAKPWTLFIRGRRINIAMESTRRTDANDSCIAYPLLVMHCICVSSHGSEISSYSTMGAKTT